MDAGVWRGFGLVLQRKRNEAVMIQVPPSTVATLIEVRVAEIRGEKVRLGFKAPGEVKVDRDEVYESKKGGPRAE